MSDKKISINTDAIADYFKALSKDMVIAYSILGLGLVLLIVGLVMM